MLQVKVPPDTNTYGKACVRVNEPETEKRFAAPLWEKREKETQNPVFLYFPRKGGGREIFVIPLPSEVRKYFSARDAETEHFSLIFSAVDIWEKVFPSSSWPLCGKFLGQVIRHPKRRRKSKTSWPKINKFWAFVSASLHSANWTPLDLVFFCICF